MAGRDDENCSEKNAHIRSRLRDPVIFNPIGVIHSPFLDVMGMPIQPAGARGITGTVEIYPEYASGLTDIEGFSHIHLIYCFDRCHSTSLHVRPFLDQREHGIFSTRAPSRPNRIGISVVRLIAVLGSGILEVSDIDILDGTPLLDIKPYIPEFDAVCTEKTGWFGELRHSASDTTADLRFMQ